MQLQATPLINLLSTSDEELARRAAADQEAFAELYHRHYPRVYRYHMARLCQMHDAQDLTAQTFMAALEGITSFRGSGSFLAWLMGIARRKAALHFRSLKDELPLELVAEAPDPSPLPEAQAGQRLQMGQITQALKRLTPERAEAISLCVFGELSAAEAANLMGKSEAAVKMLLLRGIQDLRAKFAPVLKEEK
jgi:RNA polymerase sigma-70 factor (ECF subfamily)